MFVACISLQQKKLTWRVASWTNAGLWWSNALLEFDRVPDNQTARSSETVKGKQKCNTSAVMTCVNISAQEGEREGLEGERAEGRGGQGIMLSNLYVLMVHRGQ